MKLYYSSSYVFFPDYVNQVRAISWKVNLSQFIAWIIQNKLSAACVRTILWRFFARTLHLVFIVCSGWHVRKYKCPYATYFLTRWRILWDWLVNKIVGYDWLSGPGSDWLSPDRCYTTPLTVQGYRFWYQWTKLSTWGRGKYTIYVWQILVCWIKANLKWWNT